MVITGDMNAEPDSPEMAVMKGTPYVNVAEGLGATYHGYGQALHPHEIDAGLSVGDGGLFIFQSLAAAAAYHIILCQRPPSWDIMESAGSCRFERKLSNCNQYARQGAQGRNIYMKIVTFNIRDLEQKMSSAPGHFQNTPIYRENLPFPTCPMNSG